MSKKPTKLIGQKFEDFLDNSCLGGEYHLQPARLIPFYKTGDERALTSIFLSSYRSVFEKLGKASS